MGERGGGGTGDTEEQGVPRVSREEEGPSVSPARGGEGEPESDNNTQIPESKLRLDWLLVLTGPEAMPVIIIIIIIMIDVIFMPVMSGRRR